ncbi:MAG: hypothetical protein VYC50_00955 [Pseudomonadota bacterium]|jgi:hypothetical protein|nr:hypothetical protein [Pseudomonadota bacterium]|tara:strand:- start:21721 stop:22116 length:396 start_codon:yes stop_codon:yes gene_type:complete
MKNNNESNNLEVRIDAIESCYEYMLAYAAQGKESDSKDGSSSDLRDFLLKMQKALNGLDLVVKDLFDSTSASSDDFLLAFGQDIKVTQGLVSLLIEKDGISSQLIDNVNASIHLRALLTDLFIIDEILRSK